MTPEWERSITFITCANNWMIFIRKFFLYPLIYSLFTIFVGSCVSYICGVRTIAIDRPGPSLTLCLLHQGPGQLTNIIWWPSNSDIIRHIFTYTLDSIYWKDIKDDTNAHLLYIICVSRTIPHVIPRQHHGILSGKVGRRLYWKNMTWVLSRGR